MFLTNHSPDSGAAHSKRAKQIKLHHLSEVVVVKQYERHRLAHGSIIDERVEAAPRIFSSRNNPRCRIALAQVSLNCQALATVFAQQGLSHICPGLVSAPGKRYPRAFPSSDLANPLADSAGAAGDEHT
jgi:hypothetical protein